MKELACLYLQRRSKEALMNVHQGLRNVAELLSLPGIHLFFLCGLCTSSEAPLMRNRRAVNLYLLLTILSFCSMLAPPALLNAFGVLFNWGRAGRR